MQLEKRFDLLLVFIFFVFSWWLFGKSFSYDPVHSQMKIARHQVGDFGLHLSLIRSFSWGNNFPPELPFFSGKPLPYHYYFDLLVGLMEKIGIRIDIAFNGLSVLAFTALLFFIYKLPQVIFEKSKFIGIISVLLFLLHSGLTFVDFFAHKPVSVNLLKELWRLPDYIYKGPFDGSLISIFFTLNVYLNQRHLIVALAISLGILYFLLPLLMKGKSTSIKNLIIIGLFLGIISGIHTLIFFGNVLIFGILFWYFKRKDWVLPVFLPAFLLSLPRFMTVLQQNSGTIAHTFFNPGFLAEKPLTLFSFLQFWFLNLGIALLLIPLGVLLSKPKQRIVFACFFLLFLIANTFQLSFRIDHNHSLINYFLLIANFYIAYVLYLLFKKNFLSKIITLILIFFLTVSGFIDLMAVKNDFHETINDAPSNAFMQWIKENTEKNAIFLARQDILDPITLSGRKNYYGSTYYLSVMGYDYAQRRSLAKIFFEADKVDTLQQMKQVGISYIVLPVKPIAEFNYSYEVNRNFFDSQLPIIYKDNTVIVYKL